MTELIQIILINLVVSIDNIGVLAMATKNLPQEKAITARKLGVGLSLILKLIFIGIIGFLFRVPWLHIRIIGGILLLYVTFNMIREHNKEYEDYQSMKKEKHGKDNFYLAIASIIAADFSMSLDNVVAIMGVVSQDGTSLEAIEFAMVIVGLLVCIPVMLWFSDAVAKLMEQFSTLIYICAGYLVYISINMIFQDEMIKLFFYEINFTFVEPTAILCGLLIIVYGVLLNKGYSIGPKEKKSSVLIIYCITVLYSLVLLGVISYLSGHPIHEGRIVRIEDIFGFLPSGANAVYLICVAEEHLGLFSIFLCSIIFQNKDKMSYKSLFISNISGMIMFILLELLVNTIGLTFTFGFGEISITTYITAFLLQILLMLTYAAVFTMISTFVKHKAVLIIYGMLYMFIESILTEVFMIKGNLYLARFFPSYYVSNMTRINIDAIWIGRILTVCIIYISFSVLVGYYNHDIKKYKNMRLSRFSR